MIDAPLALAFTAGLVATVNPCGFAMLPAYLSFFLGLDDGAESTSPAGRLSRALVVGGVVSAGFLAVFSVVGILVSAGLSELRQVVPWIAIVVGVGVAALGIAMIAGFEPQLALPKVERGGDSRRYRSVFVFGVSYAIASLSCALPVFLVVVAGTTTEANFASGLASFAAYGAGMSLVLLVLTVAVAMARQSMVGLLRSSMRYVNRVSGVLLVLAGGYLTFYWLDAQVGDGGSVGTGAVYDWSFELSARIQEGGGVRIGAALGAVVFGSVAVVLASRAKAELTAIRRTPAS